MKQKFYKLDFNEARKGVDLSTLKLDPEKAEVNKYIENITSRERVVKEVNKYKGVPYLWGGSNPSAFDCSGLVQWTIKKSHGITIPRTTDSQYNKWRNAMKKNLNSAEPGDLVYFKTRGNNPVSHVGVYLGDNNFIHAPKSNDIVKISKLEGYWADRLVGYVNLNTVLL